MTTSDSNSIYEIMRQFLIDSNFEIEELPERAAIRTTFTGTQAAWLCVARAREQQRQFVFYSIAPVEIQQAARAMASEFLHRVNFGLIVGSFEFDLDDGEVRIKTYIDVGDTVLTAELIKPVVIANVLMMEKYLPAIQAVNQGMPPQEAIAWIEGN